MTMMTRELNDDDWVTIEQAAIRQIKEHVLRMAADAASSHEAGTTIIKNDVVGNIVEGVIIELVCLLREGKM